MTRRLILSCIGVLVICLVVPGFVYAQVERTGSTCICNFTIIGGVERDVEDNICGCGGALRGVDGDGRDCEYGTYANLEMSVPTPRIVVEDFVAAQELCEPLPRVEIIRIVGSDNVYDASSVNDVFCEASGAGGLGSKEILINAGDRDGTPYSYTFTPDGPCEVLSSGEATYEPCGAGQRQYAVWSRYNGYINLETIFNDYVSLYNIFDASGNMAGCPRIPFEVIREAALNEFGFPVGIPPEIGSPGGLGQDLYVAEGESACPLTGRALQAIHTTADGSYLVTLECSIEVPSFETVDDPPESPPQQPSMQNTPFSVPGTDRLSSNGIGEVRALIGRIIQTGLGVMGSIALVQVKRLSFGLLLVCLLFWEVISWLTLYSKPFDPNGRRLFAVVL